MLLNLVYKTDTEKGFDGLVQVEATNTIKCYLRDITNKYIAIPTSDRNKIVILFNNESDHLNMISLIADRII